MISVPTTIQYLTLLTFIVGVVAYIYKTYRDFSTHYDQDTIQRLNESRDILKEENSDLKAKLMALEARIKALEQTNETLKGVLAGKDTIDKFQNTLDQFLPYVAAFQEFQENDKLILAKLDTLLGVQHAKRKKSN